MAEISGQKLEANSAIQSPQEIVLGLHETFTKIKSNPDKFDAFQDALIDLREYRQREQKLHLLKEKGDDSLESKLEMWQAGDDSNVHKRNLGKRVKHEEHYKEYTIAYDAISDTAQKLEDAYKRDNHTDPLSQVISDLGETESFVNDLIKLPTNNT